MFAFKTSKILFPGADFHLVGGNRDAPQYVKHFQLLTAY